MPSLLKCEMGCPPRAGAEVLGLCIAGMIQKRTWFEAKGRGQCGRAGGIELRGQDHPVAAVSCIIGVFFLFPSLWCPNLSRKAIAGPMNTVARIVCNVFEYRYAYTNKTWDLGGMMIGEPIHVASTGTATTAWTFLGQLTGCLLI